MWNLLIKIKNAIDPLKPNKSILENCYLGEIDEEQANKILNTEPVIIKESGVFNDIRLSEKERIEHARKILEHHSNFK